MLIFIQNNLFLIIKECFANVETCFVAVLRKKSPYTVVYCLFRMCSKGGCTNKIIIMASEEWSVNSKHVCVCMYVCTCACIYVHACMCVCVYALKCVNLFVNFLWLYFLVEGFFPLLTLKVRVWSFICL